jgi:transcriptional regulator with XRE-family HTH domain
MVETEEVCPMHDESIGTRIATERKARGLTQLQLAERANISVSLLRKVEQGNRPASAVLMTSVARALGVVQAKLTGQPYYSGDRRLDMIHDLVDELRGEVVAYRLPPADDDPPARPLPELAAAVTRVSQLRQRADFARLAVAVTNALRDLRTASYTYLEADREQVMGLLAETYISARLLAHKLGYADLASTLADRYEWAAWQSGDRLAVAIGDTMRARELVGAGQWSGAERVLTDSMKVLEPDLPDARPEVLSVYGYLHLEAALVAARAAHPERTWAHHTEATTVAQRIGDDRNDYRLAFGLTNVKIWGVALGVELQDAPAALHRAGDVHLTSATPRSRAGHHYIDLARAQLLNGNRPAVLESLLTARKIAPQQTRYHPMARETVYGLARAERRSSESLRGLAVWMGVPD